jgi:hypothetical protein
VWIAILNHVFFNFQHIEGPVLVPQIRGTPFREKPIRKLSKDWAGTAARRNLWRLIIVAGKLFVESLSDRFNPDRSIVGNFQSLVSSLKKQSRTRGPLDVFGRIQWLLYILITPYVFFLECWNAQETWENRILYLLEMGRQNRKLSISGILSL